MSDEALLKKLQAKRKLLAKTAQEIADINSVFTRRRELAWKKKAEEVGCIENLEMSDLEMAAPFISLLKPKG